MLKLNVESKCGIKFVARILRMKVFSIEYCWSIYILPWVCGFVNNLLRMYTRKLLKFCVNIVKGFVSYDFHLFIYRLRNSFETRHFLKM